ncbi:MAG TPA: endonuclease/exonuclease/phosphatase family protein [Tepidisphaeraceae bacterium]|nr:endonuclease/exonuclease/phosphatase family protein [Tepidisphaeraceae bacterium]
MLKRPRRLALLVLIPLIVIAAVAWWVTLPVSTGPAEGSSFPGIAATQPVVPSTLRIATFNIDGGRGTDGVVDLERTARSLQRIDFVGLNEVHNDLFGSQQNQAASLAAPLHTPGLFVPSERRLGRETFGNAVFTRLPVKHWQRIVLPSGPFKAPRNYLLTDVDWHGVTVHFLTTHTDWKSGGAEQRQIVADAFLNLPEPAVLMGDLNAPQHDPLIERLLASKGVEEAIDAILGPEPGRVDWIFLRGLTALDAGRVDIGASDHPAYWAQVRLRSEIR